MRTSLLSFFAFAAFAANAVAQTTAPAASTYVWKGKYPPLWEIAATNTTLVKQWVAALNMSSVPKIAVSKIDSKGAIVIPTGGPAAGACHWTYDGCVNNDVMICPQVGDFGLTYDDGPTAFSAKLYDFLDTTNQKATLFMVGTNIMQFPELAIRACQSGHHIAIHSWSHHAMTSLTNEQVVAEVKYTEMAIKELCNITPRYFRPPFGDVDNRVRAILTQLGYINVIWDLDTNDWQMPPGGSQTEAAVDALFAKWIAGRPTDTAGHICLEHDLYQSSVDVAIKNLPAVQNTFQVLDVATCLGDTRPYVEDVPFGKNTTSATASLSVVPSSLVANTVSPGVETLRPTGTNVPAPLRTSGASSLHSSVFALLSVAFGVISFTL